MEATKVVSDTVDGVDGVDGGGREDVQNDVKTNENTQNEIKTKDEWIALDKYPEYEINTCFIKGSYEIRKKDTHESPRIWHRKDGYCPIYLNRWVYLHEVIADQFVPNPDPKRLTTVDHIDRDRTNNNITNLRHVSPSFNNRNKSHYKHRSYEYSEFPTHDGMTVLSNYNSHTFCTEEDSEYRYFYRNGEFYVDLKGVYRKLFDHDDKYVYCRNQENKYVKVSIRKFQQLCL
jgi:hypothetical protein